MNQDEELKTKRLKIYLAPLLPINPPLIAKLDMGLVNINKSQVFIYSDDIYRELFSYILLEKGKEIGRKPTYRIVTLVDLVNKHFANEDLKPLCFPDFLFITHTSGYTGNSIYGPVFSKVVEERNLVNRPTYLFFRGNFIKAKALGVTEGREIVNFGSESARPVTRDCTQYQKFNNINIPKEQIDDEEEDDTIVKKTPKISKTCRSNIKQTSKSSGNSECVDGTIEKVVDNPSYGRIM